jgi:hypothetical protein
MTNKDKTNCLEHEERIKRCFDFLINDHNYTLTFLGMHGWLHACFFGMESLGKPKFQFGGSVFGSQRCPYVAVAASTVEYRFEIGIEDPWISIRFLDDFVSDRGATWLYRNRTERRDWETDLIRLAETTKRLLPLIYEVFSNEKSLSQWRKKYDEWIRLEFDQFMDQNREKYT